MSAVSGSGGAVLFNLEGTQLENLFGRAVCGLGDVNADGVGDFAVGVPHEDAGFANAGMMMQYSGSVTDACALELAGGVSAGSAFALRHLGRPGAASLVLGDVNPGPVTIGGLGSFALGFTPFLTAVNDSAGLFGTVLGGPLAAQGMVLVGPFGVPPQAVGITVHLQAFALTLEAPNGMFQRSNPLSVTFTP